MPTSDVMCVIGRYVPREKKGLNIWSEGPTLFLPVDGPLAMELHSLSWGKPPVSHRQGLTPVSLERQGEALKQRTS